MYAVVTNYSSFWRLFPFFHSIKVITNFADKEFYASACTASGKLVCEVGDTSAKFGTINLAGSNGVKRYLYTDINVALSGAYTVIGRSFTIHGPSKAAARFACADIVEQVRSDIFLSK